MLEMRSSSGPEWVQKINSLKNIFFLQFNLVIKAMRQ